jgi:hypothetical protein
VLSRRARRTADALDALRAGQLHGDHAFGKKLRGRLRRDWSETWNIDDRGERRDRECARRIEMRGGVLLIGGVTRVSSVPACCVIDALEDRSLVRTERELQPMRIGGEHEPDRQKCARHQ